MKLILLMAVVFILTVEIVSMTRTCWKNSNCSNGRGFCKRRYWWKYGRCVNRRPDGHPCHDSNLCLSGQCTCGICGSKLPNGKKCSTNDNCRSGWCNPRVTFGCRGTCKPKLPDNFPCGGRIDPLELRKMCHKQSCSSSKNCRIFCGMASVFDMHLAKEALIELWRMGHNARCESGQCTCGTCGKRLHNGKQCSTNDNCLSRRCNGWITANCWGKCGH